MTINELLKNIKELSNQLNFANLALNNDRRTFYKNRNNERAGIEPVLSEEEQIELDMRLTTEREVVLGLEDKKRTLEKPLENVQVLATDMLKQLEASTGKKWKIVPYADKTNMVKDTEELAPFFDWYCEPRGGIIFASETSPLYNETFVMINNGEPKVDAKENIMLECGTYHIRYDRMDEDIKASIADDTKEVDLLRRDNAVVGAYVAREKTTEIDAFDGTVDPRIKAYVERVLTEQFKNVDINVTDGAARKRK